MPVQKLDFTKILANLSGDDFSDCDITPSTSTNLKPLL